MTHTKETAIDKLINVAVNEAKRNAEHECDPGADERAGGMACIGEQLIKKPFGQYERAYHDERYAGKHYGTIYYEIDVH